MAHLPSWVEPPPSEPGSIDPLGYLAPAERIAEQLLPGVTVLTMRARYLSFLCWAIRETDNQPKAIDQWEIALGVGEHLTHGSNGDVTCGFLGSRLLNQRDPRPGDRVPSRLHVQTARLLYSGLLRSCGLGDARGHLTDLGTKIADEFDRKMPPSLPKRVGRCERMPCLSEMGERERRWVQTALFKENGEGATRERTFKEVGVRAWRATWLSKDAVSLLSMHILPPGRGSGESARLLHNAAKLELQALPLTRLFLYLYKRHGEIQGSIPRNSSFQRFRIRETPRELLADLAAHLRKAAALGSSPPPVEKLALIRWLIQRHRTAKAEAPWVDEDWRVLRPGLDPQKPPGVHGYRLVAFASLLKDIGLL